MTNSSFISSNTDLNVLMNKRVVPAMVNGLNVMIPLMRDSMDLGMHYAKPDVYCHVEEAILISTMPNSGFVLADGTECIHCQVYVFPYNRLGYMIHDYLENRVSLGDITAVQGMPSHGYMIRKSPNKKTGEVYVKMNKEFSPECILSETWVDPYNSIRSYY